ncbi:MAG: alpha/beta hydrolase, partial [Rikenellaceae bacterium]|nr:alpha/beta hydrolase [Rikenellaceae bacterium]
IELIRSGRKEVLVKMNPQRRFAAENCKRLASVIDELKEMAFLTEDEGILAILRGISQRGNYVEMMSKTEIPTLFVFGSGDLMIPQEACEEVAKQFPAAQVVVLDSCGHMSFIEQPEKTLEIVTQFCDKLNF